MATLLAKKAAQDWLMQGLRVAIARLPAHDDETRKEAEKQFRRVEKLFGYEPGSWATGA